MKDKKADAQMISYVILIVIALSLSVAVYSFLKLRVPSDREVCPEEIFVAIEKASCSVSGQKLNLSISNRGLFNVSALFVRLGEENRKIRQQINRENEILPNPLPPGDHKEYIYSIPFEVTSQKYTVEVQPAIFTKERNRALCKSIVTQSILCS